MRRAQDVWLRLERRLQAAIPTFLAAQQAQRFNPRGLAVAVDLVDDGDRLADADYAGPDLLVGPAAQLASRDLTAEAQGISR